MRKWCGFDRLRRPGDAEMLFTDSRDLRLFSDILSGFFFMALDMRRAQVGFAVLSAVDQSLDVIQVPLLALNRQAAKVATVIPGDDPVPDTSWRAVIVGLSDPFGDCAGQQIPHIQAKNSEKPRNTIPPQKPFALSGALSKKTPTMAMSPNAAKIPTIV